MGSGSLRSSHQTRSRPKLAFVFGAENGLFGHFRLFVFGQKWIFILVLFFVFVPKMPFTLGRKCYVRNWTVTKFCDIETGDFRFRFSAEKGISFSSAFSFTAENKKCNFGRPLHQTVSDYTLRQWFSNTQQSRFLTAYRCLEKLVLPSIFDKVILRHHHHRRRVVRVTVAPLRDPWRSQISTA